MNLYIRFFITLVRGFFKSNMTLADGLNKQLRVLPNDIDINGHMNNGRYLTIIDLFVLEVCLRTKILVPAIKLGWMPIIGGHMITYKGELKILEKYTVDFKMCCWNDDWTFFSYTFINSKGRIVATGYAKGAWVSKKGIVKNNVIEEKLHITRPDFPIPDEIITWLGSEKQMIASASKLT